MAAILAALTWGRTNWRLLIVGLAAVALLLAVWRVFDAGRELRRPGKIGRP